MRLKLCLLLFVLLVSCQNSEDVYMSPELNEFPSIQGSNLNKEKKVVPDDFVCLLYTSPSPRDQRGSRMPSSA